MAEDLKIRHYTDISNFATAMMQQLSYVSMIGLGAWLAISNGMITTGALVACSILSGRVLGPVAAIPGLVSQWAYARVSMDQLDTLLALRSENDTVAKPLTPDSFDGAYRMDGTAFAYSGNSQGVRIEKLTIQGGERVGIIGTIGSGKSTLMKMLAGIFPTQSGQVLLDGLDMKQLSRSHFAEHCGYLPQDPRLFSGTLRDNLLQGLPARSQEEVVEAAQLTGLLAHISSDPRGLDLPISEGGGGLSRGQRQLVAMTRLILQRPAIWLLDEPTSGMDEQTETQCIRAIEASIRPTDTLVLVTHRLRLTHLVSRLVVLVPGGIALDGPKDAVIKQLSAPQPSASVNPQETARQKPEPETAKGHKSTVGVP